MADQNEDNRITPAGDAPGGDDEAVAPTAGADDTGAAEAADGAVAEARTTEAGETAGESEPVNAEPEEAEETDEAEEEPALTSPFGAQFSSPEPTAVVARPRRRATRPAAAADPESVAPPPAVPAFISFVAPPQDLTPAPRRRRAAEEAGEETEEETGVETATRSRRGGSRRRGADDSASSGTEAESPEAETAETEAESEEDEDREEGAPSGSRRRRRGRRGRGRGRTGDEASDEGTDDEEREERESEEESEDGEEAGGDEEQETGSSTRRRRRRRRRGGGEDRAEEAAEEPEERGGRRPTSDDDVRGVTGSTRLEAKRQRRRDGRDNGRRRTPILSEAEFLARREAVDRKMVIRQRGERTQIAVLEDDVLVEHYVTQAQGTSFAGNVYLGRVQNVLPSMEAAFVDIGKGRNAVLYAGEVNWDAAGLSGKQRSIEQALKSGDKVLVQVTKDPIGHKGARLTQQVNLPGRFLVYVPGGSMTGISRKLPDTERQRLKDILKKIVPDDAGVIIRTAAEGASEEELTRDVNRLKAQWEVIEKKVESATSAPSLLYGEPDLAIRVIRDVFNEDFKELVVQGDDAWDTVEAYVAHVSPELSGRLNRYTGTGDVFHDLRIDEQLAKALDRKVWLPSGGSLVIDRTEAMTVIDVNTGKFTGSGGNLEQTVTRNNMEAAEEIVRQLRLRDIGGIIVIDFIDMVLESNRDLVLRRLTECLGRDRTKHQVAEVTSLGLVQMTRKRVGQGLLEVFSEPCEHCRGRGVIVHTEPVDERRRSGAGGGNGGGSGGGSGGGNRREGGRSERSGGREGRAEGREKDGGEESGAAAEAESAAVEGAAADDETGRAGSRRNRGRRQRGASGGEREAEETAAEPSAAEVPGGQERETAPVAEEAAATSAGGDGERHAEGQAEGPAEGHPGGDGAGEVQGALTARPRRRRAASRPAGPPA